LSGLLGFITAHFIWSIENQDDLRAHPPFADFASGMLWQHDNNVEGYSLTYFPSEQIAELKRRFPPRKLDGMIGFRWRLPRRQDQARKNGDCLTASLVDWQERGRVCGRSRSGRGCEKKPLKLLRQRPPIPGGSRWSACAAKSTSLIT
jgi:hypothetical protein